MAKQLLGRVAMDFKGEFNSSSAYEKLDVIVYEGCSYCALKETKGNLPTNEDFFALLVRKPIEGLDYFTEDEKEEFVSRITDDANSLFNQNVESKTKEFNTNHQDKVNDFNNNYDTKLNSFNSNYDSKVKSFNNNASNQTTTFNENVVEKQKEFDDNVTNQTETFNTNATNKINEYNTNASNKLNDYNSNDNDKLKAYNDNTSTKVEEYNTNANNKVEEFNTNAEEKTNEFNSTANVQKITSLSNEFYRVKDEVLETGEASDTFIHLEDSSMSELQELEIEGVCEQKTTSGNQLFKDIPTQTKSGVTLTNNNDGTYILNGTATENTSFFVLVNYTAGTYSLSLNNDANLPSNCYTQLETSNDHKRVTFTSDNKKTFECDNINALSVVIAIGTTINNLKFAPMLELGAEFNPVEKYTGGEPSPSPEYPQEIKTITGNLNLISCNKNIFDINKIYEKNMFYEVIDDKWLYIESIYFNTYGNFKVNSNSTYMLKFDSTDYTWGTRIIQFDKDGNFIKGDIFKSNDQSFTTLQNCKFIRISCNKEVNSNIQIEESLKSTSFEQNLQSQITANLPNGEFLGKIDDSNKDTLNIKYNVEDGKYHLVLEKNVVKIGLDGSETILNEASVGTFNKFIFSVNDVIKSSGISTHYKYLESYTKDISHFYLTTNQIIIFDTHASSAELKSWLNKNNVEFYGALKKPYAIDLGPVEMPLSYNEITNIFTDSDLLPRINAKYYRNFKKTVQNLQVNNDTLKNELISIENRLTALENANTSTVDVDESGVTE